MRAAVHLSGVLRARTRSTSLAPRQRGEGATEFAVRADSTSQDCVLAGALPLHRPKVGPLVHHPAIGKPADAVLAARALANLALAAALGAEYRRRIRKAPRALRADDQHGKEDQRDRPPHLIILSPLRLVFDILSHGAEAPDASALRRRDRRHGQRRSGDHGRGFSQSARRGQSLAVTADAQLSVDRLVLGRSYNYAQVVLIPRRYILGRGLPVTDRRLSDVRRLPGAAVCSPRGLRTAAGS